MRSHLVLSLAMLAVLSACKRDAADTATTADTPAAPAAPTAAPAAPAHTFANDINTADFAEMVQTLSSDAFEGRGPGSVGEDKTVEYIQTQMQRIGLKPGNGNSYFQDVSMVETTADTGTVLTLDANGKTRELKFGSDMVIGTRTGQPEVKVQDSELVFVGYGVDAPNRSGTTTPARTGKARPW